MVGELEGYRLFARDLRLKRKDQIRLLQSSPAIEGNTLTKELIAALPDDKTVWGHPRELLEVKKNALGATDSPLPKPPLHRT